MDQNYVPRTGNDYRNDSYVRPRYQDNRLDRRPAPNPPYAIDPQQISYAPPHAARHSHTQPRMTQPKRSLWSFVSPYLSTNGAVIAAGIILAGILITGIIIAIQLTSSGPDTLTVVQQPATASQIAQKLGCTKFKDLGGSTKTSFQGILDSGNCYIDGTKYAINTFVSEAVRDKWIPLAEQLGVVPKWETDTSVTYKSVTGN